MDIYLNWNKSGGGSCLLDGKSSSALGTQPGWMQKDKEPFNLYFRTPNGQSQNSSPVDLAGWSIVISGKMSLSDVALDLFDDDGFVAAGADDDLHYSNSVTVDSAALDTHLATETSVQIFIDIECIKNDGTEIRTFRLKPTISKRVRQGTESLPETPEPEYLLKSEFEARLAALFNIANGKRLLITDEGNVGSEDVP